ncbi:MAG: methyl-accepting chemotaxis protein [Candidatus Delongbacteria bacterium]
MKLNDLSIQTKLGAMFGTIVLMVMVGAAVVVQQTGKQLDDSKLVNLAGRQRMLVQKITRLATDYQLMAVTGMPPEVISSIQRELDETMILFEHTQDALRDGDDKLGIEPIGHAALRADLDSAKVMWKDFDDQLHFIIRSPAGSPEALAAVTFLRANHQSIIGQYNDITTGFEEASTNNVKLVRALILLAILGTSSVSVVSVLLARKMISRPITELADVARQVESGNLDLVLKVKSADEIGQLRSSINEMIAGLKRGRGETQHAAAQAEGMVERIHQTVAALQQGHLKERVDTRGAEGKFRQLGLGVNSALDTLTSPIHQTSQVLAQYANGDFSAELRDLPGELQQLPDSLKHIRENLELLIQEIISVAEAVQEGRMSSRGQAAEFQGSYRVVIERFNQSLDAIGKPFAALNTSLEQVAGGDLRSRMECTTGHDIGVLTARYNDTIASMEQVLAQAKGMVQSVDLGSRQVSDTSQALSQGATEQAAALEEISSSLIEVAGQTRTNAANASQANLLSNKARDAAHRGNQQMQRMLEAMQDISKSSKEISRIMKVIDEIAFQTNLLSLNAAVEAARAGAHGRGFAVVADEVRNLAQRSAKAAQETSELIEGSVRVIDQGGSIAAETAGALAEIVTGITQAGDLVSEINSASSEQSTAIEQVTEALKQIDEVTQTNTASAEEGASSAQELSSLAGRLRDELGRFQVSGEAVRQPAAAAPARSAARATRPAAKPARSTRGVPRPASRPAAPPPDEGKGWVDLESPLRPEDIIHLDDHDFGEF